MELGPLELVFLNETAVELWSIRSETGFYYNLRADLVLAETDVVVTNDALLPAGIPLREGVRLRIGVADELQHVPASG